MLTDITIPFNQLSSRDVSDQKSRAIQLPIGKAPSYYILGILVFYLSLGLAINSVYISDIAIIWKVLIISMSTVGFLLTLTVKTSDHIITISHTRTRILMRVWIFYAFYAIFITTIRSEELGRSIFYGSPYIYMVLAMIIAYRHIQTGFHPKYLFNSILIMAVLHSILTFYFARTLSVNFDEDEFGFIDDIRYQIISPGNSVLYCWALFYIAKNRNILVSSIFLISTIFIFAIAKTRGMIPAVSFSTLYIILISRQAFGSTLRIFFLMFIGPLVAYAIAYYARDIDLYDVWISRIFNESFSFQQETTLSRFAEYAAQIKLLVSDIQSGLFGFGYLKEMIWDGYIWDRLYPTLDPTYYYLSRGVGVHSTWINSLFVGGFIFGTIPTLTFLYCVYIAVRHCFMNTIGRENLNEYYYIPTAMIMFMFGPAFTGFLFGERLGPALFGFCIVYTVFGWEQYVLSKGSERASMDDLSANSLFPTGQSRL